MKRDIKIAEPVNFEALAEAFVIARWRWLIGSERHFPTSEGIAQTIEQLRKDSAEGYMSTGGIGVGRGGEGVYLDPKLFAAYHP